MKLLTKLTMLLAITALTACGGGGGGGGGHNGGTGSTGGVQFTHGELAAEFVYRMNVDAGYDLDLVKSYTLQDGYVVVYDYDVDTYDAYYIGDYHVGENLFNYLDYYSADFFYDLDPIGGSLYEDYWTGITFEKAQATSKDLLKMAALKETLQVKKSAEHIAAEYGLSESRSLEVAKLSFQWKNTPKDRMTDTDHDHFAKEILGYSISEYKAAAKKMAEGDKSDLKALVDGTAAHNGVSPEEVDEIIKDVFQVSAM